MTTTIKRIEKEVNGKQIAICLEYNKYSMLTTWNVYLIKGQFAESLIKGRKNRPSTTEIKRYI